MEFVDRYARALGASNLQDRQAEPLLAAAFAAAGATGELGPLLLRVRYVDDPLRTPSNLAQLLRLWTAHVINRGRARKWASEKTPWDAQTAHTLYRTVAELSLAHWLDGVCKSCNGTGKHDNDACRDCAGKGDTPVQHAGAFVRERVKDMVSELHGIASDHAARANARLHGRQRANPQP